MIPARKVADPFGIGVVICMNVRYGKDPHGPSYTPGEGAIASRLLNSRLYGLKVGWNVEDELEGSRYLSTVASVPAGPTSMYRFGPLVSSRAMVCWKRMGRLATVQK